MTPTKNSKKEENLKGPAMILLPFSGNLTNEFYEFLLEDSYSASFIKLKMQ